MKKIFFGLVSVAILSGCTSMPTQADIQSADYGKFPSNSIEISKAYYETVAKDPDSLKYREITDPKKYYLGSRVDGAMYGYLVCVTVNGKNSYGAYTGFKRDALLIKNGNVIKFIPKGDWWGKQVC